MSEEQKKMSIKKFRELGFIQELNRNFLHPVGLALDVEINEETGEEVIKEIVDNRDEDGGMIFKDEEIDMGKFRSVRDLFSAKVNKRQALLGFIVQPVEKIKKILTPGRDF